MKVAILGGGMGALSSAFHLIKSGNSGENITIYESSGRLGGKGASSVNPQKNYRIEEHGLHVLMGCYHNSLNMMEEVYRSLEAENTPGILSFDSAFKQIDYAVFKENIDREWQTWPVAFEKRETRTLKEEDFTLPNPHYYLKKIIWYTKDLVNPMLELFQDIVDTDENLQIEVPKGLQVDKQSFVKMVTDPTLALMYLSSQLSKRDLEADEVSGIAHFISMIRTQLCQGLTEVETLSHDYRRARILTELALSLAYGVVSDLYRASTFDPINNQEFKEWLSETGAREDVVNSAPIRGFYDLAIAFDYGKGDRPNIAAGAMLQCLLRMLFEYRESFFWKMTAGMGETIFAPLYLYLKKKGVNFRFFHTVRKLSFEAEKNSLQTIELNYLSMSHCPLKEVNGLMRFEDKDINPSKSTKVKLSLGRDFDYVVNALPVSAMKQIELTNASTHFINMLKSVKTIGTISLQIWLKRDLEELGWSEGSVILNGFSQPFNTWADMTHLLPQESWSNPKPKSLAYFCGPLEDCADDVAYLRARKIADEWIRENIRNLWPNFEQANLGLDSTEISDFYLRVNLDGSERFTLSDAGSIKNRIEPSKSAVLNMVLAGDWTKNGIDLSCLEATVLSGRLAANHLNKSNKEKI